MFPEGMGGLLIKKCYAVLLYLFCFGCFADALTLSADMKQTSLVGYAEILVEPQHEILFEQIITSDFASRFRPFSQAEVNRGITHQAVWLKFSIHNPSSRAIEWVLTPETSYIDNIDIYFTAGSSSQQATPNFSSRNTRAGASSDSWQHRRLSDYLAFSSRDIAYRLLNAKFVAQPGESSSFYVRLSSNTLETMNVQLFVEEKGAFKDRTLTEYFLFGIYFGLFTALALLTVILWSYTRSYSYKYYIYFLSYLVFNIVMWTSLNGFSFQYFWPDSPQVFNQSFHILYLCVAIFSFLFGRQLLNTRLLLPRVDKLLLGLIALYVLAVILRLFGVYELVLYISFFSLLSMAFQPVLGWLCYRKGNTYVLLYIVAWVPYGISLILSLISASSQWSAFGMGLIHLTQAAVLFECLMLILATLDKMRSTSSKLQRQAQLSKLDPLTNLGNRRHLSDHIAYLADLEEREGEYWLLLIDIDHFKQVNDRYGHATGDKVLVELAQILKNECRSVDVAIRWGGEEFIVLINVASQKMAYNIAERIRQTFMNSVSESGNQTFRHTLSIGMDELIFDSPDAFSVGLEGADKALYQAKNAGRNRVVSFADGVAK
ncbi:GGDEF domain-containing protein [Corallincola holothuriorum]|uniref:diguanylate cyclase n=1 Tax=Corallincola holothuriorum TaxID=2282215 RepID=A0A368NKF6_9GAMM|nr:GGDEF domain-containing protein [Corallincola holothuriorum]